MDILMHEKPGTGPTHLTCIHEDTKADGFRCITEICIGEDDVRTFPTEFERDGRQLFTGLGHDGLSCRDAARQHHAVDAGMAGQGVPSKRA